MKRFLLLWLSHVSLVLVGLLAACQARGDTVLRLALPQSYGAAVHQCLTDGTTRCGTDPSLRYHYALGSDYQILEWLQNGKVDGAVVSAMTIALLRRTLGDQFDTEFLVRNEIPLNRLALRRYAVVLEAERDGVPIDGAGAELEVLLRKLLAREPDIAVRIDLPSHLSDAVTDLFGRVRQVTGTAADPPEPFMSDLLSGLRFGSEDVGKEPWSFRFREQEGGPIVHSFIARRLALPEQFSKLPSQLPPLEMENAFLDYRSRIAGLKDRKSELRRFATGNYVNEDAGWRGRFRFSFTLDELRDVLRSHAVPNAANDDGIALVLTGGGVKAAYQTKLIDHLYGKGYLHNLYSTVAARQTAVPVKYVVGTSGGALLGVFVASLNGAGSDLDLSQKLWYRHENGQPVALLSSTDVFPKVDLMRWLSFVWCIVIFALICLFTAIYLQRRRRYVPAGVQDGDGRFFRSSFLWILLLAATPWLLVYMNGRHGAEHIPAIQGVFYFLFLLVAIYSDNRLVVRDTPRPVESVRWPLALGIAGVAVVAAALLGDRDQPFLDSSITLPALIACFGVLMIFLSLHWALVRCSRWLSPLPRDVLPAFLVLVGVCVSSYLLLFGAVWLGYASLFELSLKFWIMLGSFALLVSLAVVFAAYGIGSPLLRKSLDFLLAAHPSRMRTPRYARMVLFFAIGWVWWNLIVAPGLYGNSKALEYFQAAASNVFGASAVGSGRDQSLDVKFHAFYAAPVTALAKRVERYVMFQPPQGYSAGGNGTLNGYRNWLSISKDPRWITVASAEDQRKLVMRVAFASGSPFPVFPAHRIELLPDLGEELLVDGGYAHNIPVEASKRLGARRVLVVNSSPREPARPAAEPESDLQYVGKLTWLGRRIIPYLYERSQVEDVLSAEDLIVAVISPSASPDGWPFLTDFREEVVRELFAQAEKDRLLRIGSVESWGRPTFLWRARTPAGQSIRSAG